MMPLPDVRKEFTEDTESYKGQGKFSHTLSRGTLAGSSKNWIKKEMKDPLTARIELMSQEFFRLIIPHQPETRLLFDESTGKNYILSEEVPGYQALPVGHAESFTQGQYTGLGQALVGSVFLQEIDLKNGNIGLDDKNRVIKIDGDWCFADGRYADFGYLDYKLTPDMIARLPFPKDFYAYNWLDIIKEDVISTSSKIISHELTHAKPFRNEVNEALLKICLLPNVFIEHYMNAYQTLEDADHYARVLGSRQDELFTSAIQNASFQAYLQTPEAQDDAQKLIVQMNKMTMSGDTGVVPVHDHERMNDRVMIRLSEIKKRCEAQQLADIENRTLRETINTLLDEIQKARINENDYYVNYYVDNVRSKLALKKTNDALSRMNDDVKNMLDSVRSAQVLAIYDIISSLRHNHYLLEKWKNKKADCIEAALLNVPIEERANVITSTQSAAVKTVQIAIASHSILDAYRFQTKSGEKAINKFTALKKRFLEITLPPNHTQQEDIEHDNTNKPTKG